MSQWVKCQCANPNCGLRVEVSESTIKEGRNSNWIIIAPACRQGPPVSHKLIRRDNTYNVYSSDLKGDIEGAIETAEIYSDPKFLELLRQSIKQMEEGKGTPWEQVKRELELD